MLLRTNRYMAANQQLDELVSKRDALSAERTDISQQNPDDEELERVVAETELVSEAIDSRQVK